MPRACTICTHEKRNEIDNALVSGVSLRDIAAQFPPLTLGSLSRHHRRHVSAALAAVETSEQADRRASLLTRIEALIDRAEIMFAAAASEGKATQALNALKELRLQLELLGKATGELSTTPTVTVNLMQSPEWLEIRGAVFAALMAYPDARAAVSGRLLEIEAGPRS